MSVERAVELHPDLSAAERRQLFQQGLDLFHRGDFFACHEAWEEIWRSTRPQPRDLFQGLIQVAVGFYHYRTRARPDIARRVLAKGRRRLASFLPQSHGLDLAALSRAVGVWECWLEEASGEPPELPEIIVLDADALR